MRQSYISFRLFSVSISLGEGGTRLNILPTTKQPNTTERNKNGFSDRKTERVQHVGNTEVCMIDGSTGSKVISHCKVCFGGVRN